jgi:hypothetical protein
MKIDRRATAYVFPAGPDFPGEIDIDPVDFLGGDLRPLT